MSNFQGWFKMKKLLFFALLLNLIGGVARAQYIEDEFTSPAEQQIMDDNSFLAEGEQPEGASIRSMRAEDEHFKPDMNKNETPAADGMKEATPMEPSAPQENIEAN